MAKFWLQNQLCHLDFVRHIYSHTRLAAITYAPASCNDCREFEILTEQLRDLSKKVLASIILFIVKFRPLLRLILLVLKTSSSPLLKCENRKS